ncbi:hypothetical protein G4D82_09990 [Flavobacterium sp. CYK-4]|uniref:DUF6671 family protein n=1 Tax=Flavobacterium lotistagni TaxID=2709660 RepID=UPI00140731BE|nr:DUF6671 family protein [Flavobacterium lotistagni]NHM07551.1 hypothetical protein [Flavobacterium lotistagni]
MKRFEGRRLLIVTQHQKEKVMAPILTEALGVHCVVSTHFDTDLLGTFSGEVDRKSDALTTVREKCLRGMQLHQCDLAVASEGSFGMHPSVFFASADDELVMLIDQKNQLEITARELSLETNFDAAEVRDKHELLSFLEKIRFPEHGIIIKKAEKNHSGMAKGITDWEQALAICNDFISSQGSAYVETDMRAMYNPSRMKVIEKATQNLVQKILSVCPVCEAPGFGITDAVAGLPCRLCRSETRSVLYHVYTCQQCSHIEKQYYPRGVREEEPLYCDYCNP